MGKRFWYYYLVAHELIFIKRAGPVGGRMAEKKKNSSLRCARYKMTDIMIRKTMETPMRMGFKKKITVTCGSSVCNDGKLIIE